MLSPNVCPDEHITFMCRGHHTSVSFPTLQAVIQVATWPRGTVERGGRGGGGGEAVRFQGGRPSPCRVRGAGGPSDARTVEPDRQGPRAGDGRAAGRGGRRGSAEGGVRGDSAGTAGRRGWGAAAWFPSTVSALLPLPAAWTTWHKTEPPGRPAHRPRDWRRLGGRPECGPSQDLLRFLAWALVCPAKGPQALLASRAYAGGCGRRGVESGSAAGSWTAAPNKGVAGGLRMDDEQTAQSVTGVPRACRTRGLITAAQRARFTLLGKPEWALSPWGGTQVGWQFPALWHLQQTDA